MISHSITLFGIRYSDSSLLDLCNSKIKSSKIGEWEKSIYRFILDWISDTDSIVVRTSGSTGAPKKMSLLKKHMVASAESTLSYFGLKEKNTAWLCLPVEYIAGKMMIVRAMVGKLNLVYTEPSSNPLIDNPENIDFVPMVQNQVANLLSSVEGMHQLEALKKLLIGGSDISPAIENTIIENGNISAWHSYAMTETITHIALRKIGSKNKLGDFEPMVGVTIDLSSKDQLVIHYPKIGVRNLVTNDLVKIYSDGSFSILGRLDDMVISGGIKIMPSIVESVVQEIINYELFVAGIPDEKLGQQLVLFIEAGSNSYSYPSLVEYLSGKLSNYLIPKNIIYLDEFMRTQSGKVNRSATVINYLQSL